MDEKTRLELAALRQRLLGMVFEIDLILAPGLLGSDDNRERITLPAPPPDPDDGV